MNRDPVLFYDDVIIYEDGSGHGYVKLQAKIRVMADRFLVLLRLFQSRPEGGVRLVDTRCGASNLLPTELRGAELGGGGGRYAHEFGEQVVICDTEVDTEWRRRGCQEQGRCQGAQEGSWGLDPHPVVPAQVRCATNEQLRSRGAALEAPCPRVCGALPHAWWTRSDPALQLIANPG